MNEMENFMKKTLCIGIFLFLMFNSCSYAYSDVDSNYWGYEAIKDLSDKGIVSGYPDGTFNPGKNITRAEFITILMKVLFPNADVSTTSEYWANGSITLAEEKNILKIEEYTEFNPDIDITRLEICKMISNSIEGLEGIELSELSDRKKFEDVSDDCEEAIIVAILSQLNILNGYPDNTVRLNEKSTRAELCAFIQNYLKCRCTLLSILNDNENILYENGIAKAYSIPAKLRKRKDSVDIPYITTEIKNVCLFPFEKPDDMYNDIFQKFYETDEPYLEYRKKFGKGNYVIAVEFETTNNTYDNDMYCGYEFLRVSFPEENINIIDAFDEDEIRRQLSGNANVGEIIKSGETRNTSAFYVVDKLPETKIRFDRDITGIFEISSFHSLIFNLESR